MHPLRANANLLGETMADGRLY